jgi:hypothetical protein
VTIAPPVVEMESNKRIIELTPYFIALYFLNIKWFQLKASGKCFGEIFIKNLSLRVNSRDEI